MNIGEVETITGISKKTIRFYEEQELLSPERAENGYRVYSDEDVRSLEEIKFLRNLAMPLARIQKVRSGKLTLKAAIERQMEEISKEQENLEKIKDIGRRIIEEGKELKELDFDSYDNVMVSMEEVRLSSMEDFNHKALRVSNVAGILFILFMLLMEALMVAALIFADEMPVWVFILVTVCIAIPIVGTLFAMASRKKELKRGEIYEATKY